MTTINYNLPLDSPYSFQSSAKIVSSSSVNSKGTLSFLSLLLLFVGALNIRPSSLSFLITLLRVRVCTIKFSRIQSMTSVVTKTLTLYHFVSCNYDYEYVQIISIYIRYTKIYLHHKINSNESLTSEDILYININIITTIITTNVNLYK